MSFGITGIEDAAMEAGLGTLTLKQRKIFMREYRKEYDRIREEVWAREARIIEADEIEKERKRGIIHDFK